MPTAATDIVRFARMRSASSALRSHAAQTIPRAGPWDATRALWADPYRFITNRCAALGTDVFRTRILLQPTLCLRGESAAALFYDPQRFQREGAAPEALRATLFGQGTVQSLDGERHLKRKALFVAATAPEQVGGLVDEVRAQWQRSLPAWAAAGSFSLYRALQPLLTRAALTWAGLPAQDVALRTRELVAMFDGAARGPLPHLRARLARRRAEVWLAEWIAAVREGRAVPQPGSVAERAAWHEEVDGTPLAPRVAAAELLNVLRPIVAVSVWITFVAHALHTHPRWPATLRADDSGIAAWAFAQEVRRHYPFFPAVVARVRQPFDWCGMHFPQGVRALLDIHGTNHDPRNWHEPQQFRPDRWIGTAQRGYAFVPQGGGEVATGHRCPGEDISMRLMLLAIEMLTGQMHYHVPRRQDLRLDLGRLPALPRDGFLISGVSGPSVAVG